MVYDVQAHRTILSPCQRALDVPFCRAFGFQLHGGSGHPAVFPPLSG